MTQTHPIFDAARRGDVSAVDGYIRENHVLLEARDPLGWTPLRAAVEENRTALVEHLIRCGARCDTKDVHGYTPLHGARSKEAVELLVAGKADVSARDNYGLTPLHNAVLNGNEPVASALIDGGAELQAVDDKGGTPLGIAQEYGFARLAQLLEPRGALV